MVTSSKELKKRSIYIYFPSTKIADEWKGRAAKQTLSNSKFVVEHVLESLRQEGEEVKGHFARENDEHKRLDPTKEISLDEADKILSLTIKHQARQNSSGCRRLISTSSKRIM
ncbi:MAG TPA: hypothetical protein VJN71_11245 [Nitrososphaerales archaeon]|nr:hypothetical protein [Nitrososphaerales archaeon]